MEEFKNLEDCLKADYTECIQVEVVEQMEMADRQ
jgi:hypothetical protein